MVFIDKPPVEIGEVVFSWTNNGANGPTAAPLAWRLFPVWMGALGGFVVALIGFFVIGGILQSRGAHIEANWFLYSLGGGALAGMLIGAPFALRATKVLSLFVGARGCVQISGGKSHLLEFAQIESIRAHVSVMDAKGLRSEAREFHVSQRGVERLWYISAARPKGDDPQYQFGEAVLSAFKDYSSSQRAS